MDFQLHHDPASFKAKHLPANFSALPTMHIHANLPLCVSSALAKSVVSNLLVSIDHLLHEGVATGFHSHTAIGAGEAHTTRASGAFAGLPARTALIFGHARESAVNMHSSPGPGEFLH